MLLRSNAVRPEQQPALQLSTGSSPSSGSDHNLKSPLRLPFERVHDYIVKHSLLNLQLRLTKNSAIWDMQDVATCSESQVETLNCDASSSQLANFVGHPDPHTRLFRFAPPGQTLGRRFCCARKRDVLQRRACCAFRQAFSQRAVCDRAQGETSLSSASQCSGLPPRGRCGRCRIDPRLGLRNRQLVRGRARTLPGLLPGKPSRSRWSSTFRSLKLGKYTQGQVELSRP